MNSIVKLSKNYQDIILYVFFGICTTLVNIITYWFCVYLLDVKVLLSSIIAWFIAVLFAYLTNRKWVFHSNAVKCNECLREFLSFYVCRLTTGFIDWGIMYVFVERFYWNDIIIKTLANIVVIILNFVASKVVIFKHVDEKDVK